MTANTHAHTQSTIKSLLAAQAELGRTSPESNYVLAAATEQLIRRLRCYWAQ